MFKKKKLLFILNVDYFLISHRLEIALAAQKAGYEVHIAAKKTNNSKIIEAHGLIMHNLKIDRSGTNIFNLFRTFINIYIIFLQIKPDIIHLISIKPILLGGLALHFFNGNPKIISSVSGLGFIFVSKGIFSSIRKKLTILLYKISLSHKNINVIFQNKSDLEIISKIAKLPKKNSILINGSGVDLKAFKFSQIPNKNDIVLFPARLVESKGIREFVDAAKSLKGYARFVICGMIDKESRDNITEELLKNWTNSKIIEYWGYCKNMPEILAKSTLIVLPSYREGLPRILCETASIGRPIITTNVPGCRDAIIENQTGLLVPARDSKALAYEIKNLIVDRAKMIYFGHNGRKLAEEKFDLKFIIEKHLSLYNEAN